MYKVEIWFYGISPNSRDKQHINKTPLNLVTLDTQTEQTSLLSSAVSCRLSGSAMERWLQNKGSVTLQTIDLGSPDWLLVAHLYRHHCLLLYGDGDIKQKLIQA